MGRYNLSPGLLAYEHEGRFYLPVFAMAAALDFQTVLSADRQVISGWALDEKNSFSFDLKAEILTLRGQPETLPAQAVLPETLYDHAPDEGDLYVAVEILNRIWPLAFSVNMPNLSVDVLADAQLPFLQKIERQKRQAALEAKQDKREKAIQDYPVQANPYRIYGLPVLDIETQHVYDTDSKSFGGRTAITGVQDLAWMSANYSAIAQYRDGKMEPTDSIRLRFDRDSNASEPLPFDLQHVEFGDTRLRHAPLLKNSTGGRGFFVTSAERKRNGAFDLITVEGDGPIGWDVEVYRNDELLHFSRLDERGQYRFEDVPLIFGNNVIRVVLYGPQGQVREKIENYAYGANMLRPGQFNYSLGMLDAERDLIPIDDKSGNQPQGATINGEFSYGINRYITGYGSFTALPTKNNDQRRDYLSFGTAMSLPVGSLQIDAYQDVSQDDTVNDKGQALDVRFITDVYGLKVNLRNALYNNFESPDAGYGDTALQRESEIGLQRNVTLPFGLLGLNLDYKNSQRRDGSRFATLKTRQTLGYNGLRLAHATTTYLDNDKHQLSAGQLTATTRINKWRLRSTLNYDMFPEAQMHGFDGELLYRASDKLSASLLARHDFPASRSGAGFQVNYDFDKFIGSLETLWSEKSGGQVTVRATTALGPYGTDGSYLMTSERLTGASAVQARVFLDKNNDGVFDADDVPLRDAKVKINSRNSKIKTDDHGLLTNLSGAGIEDATIELDTASLEDPYHLPVNAGFVTALRPGALPRFDFPVIETGAIDGTATYADGRPLPGMILQLIGGADNKPVQTTQTAYDGFYTFEYVPPGAYTVRADPSHNVDLAPQTVIVATDHLFSSGIDLAMGNVVPVETIAVAQNTEFLPVPEADTSPAALSFNPPPPEDLPPAIVSRAEILENKDNVRVSFDLSGPVSYDIEVAETGRTIFVDLPQATWKAVRKWRGSSGAVLAAYDIEPLKSGGIRLKLSSQRKMALGVDGIQLDRKGDRLSFELVRQ